MTETVLTRLIPNPSADLSALSPIQLKTDQLVSLFVEEAANPRTLAAISAGGLAYRLGRVGTMGLNVGAIGQSPLRLLSMGVGLAGH